MVKKIFFIIIFSTVLSAPQVGAEENIFHGRIHSESFEPIKRYEAEFQKAAEKNPKLFALILVSIFHKLSREEMRRMFTLVEEDLTYNKVDPRDATKIFKYALYWAFVNELGEQEINQTPTREQLREIEKEIEKETEKEE